MNVNLVLVRVRGMSGFASDVDVFMWTEEGHSRVICLPFSIPSFSRCPSPILHELTGEMQGGDIEIHREREPTLERTRSAGEV